MTAPLTDGTASTVTLVVERLEAEALVRIATIVAKASEHFSTNTLVLWLCIADTRETLDVLCKGGA